MDSSTQHTPHQGLRKEVKVALLVGFICVIVAVYWAYKREYSIVSITLLALITAVLWPLIIPLILELERKRGDWGKEVKDADINASYKETDYEEESSANSSNTHNGKKDSRSRRVKVPRSNEHL